MIGKVEKHKKKDFNQGYIAMIAVDNKLRGQGIVSKLVRKFEEDAIAADKIEALCLDTECVNRAALNLYNCKLTSSRLLQSETIQKLLSEWK